MFQRSAYALALNALDQAGGHFPGQVGVFGEIFEVAAAQGVRFMLTPGPRSTSTPRAMASSANACPISNSNSTSQVAARLEAVGKQVAGRLFWVNA
jgi:hypothetical protein